MEKTDNSISMNNGTYMPPIGYGVFRMTDEKQCEDAVLQALNAGYRLIDTAAAYENEQAVGRAIKKSGIPRNELFITTKLWITDTCYKKTKEAFSRSLNRLGLDYVDLYLIHQPYNDYYGAWRAMEELYEESKVKAIGVDNFTQNQLADFLFFNKVKPAVNMIECNTFFQRQDEAEYMNKENIQMQAWSPIATLDTGHSCFNERKTAAQVTDFLKFPEGEYLTAYHAGNWKNIGTAYQRMIAYIKEHNLLVDNDYMERYLIDILAVDNPDSYITEITVRLKN